MSEFNSSIKKKRIELGITQKQLAELVGVSSNTISKWESGTMPRYFIHVARMGEIFNDKEFIENLHKEYMQDELVLLEKRINEYNK